MADDDDYDIGYGKPPSHSRFKKGQSGNPRGRPKGSASFPKLIEKHLNRLIPSTFEGKQKRISVKEGASMKLVSIALTGTPDQRMKAFRLINSLLPGEDPATEQFDYSKLSDDELDQLEALIMKGSVSDPE